MIFKEEMEKEKILFFCSIISQNMVLFLKQGLKLSRTFPSDFVFLEHSASIWAVLDLIPPQIHFYLIDSSMAYIPGYSQNYLRKLTKTYIKQYILYRKRAEVDNLLEWYFLETQIQTQPN